MNDLSNSTLRDLRPDLAYRGLMQIADNHGDVAAAKVLAQLSATQRLAIFREGDASTNSLAAAIMEPEDVVETLLALPQTWSDASIDEDPGNLLREVSEVLTTALFNATDERRYEIVRLLTRSVSGTTMLAIVLYGVTMDEEAGIDPGWNVYDDDSLGLRAVESLEGPDTAVFIAQVLENAGGIEAVEEVLFALEQAPTMGVCLRGLREMRYSTAPKTPEEMVFEPVF